jgi:rhodanese-related sulfurtransferase
VGSRITFQQVNHDRRCGQPVLNRAPSPVNVATSPAEILAESSRVWVLAMSERFQQRARPLHIQALEARRLIWEGAELVDARGLEEFTSSHLEGAHNLGSQADNWDIHTALTDLDAPIVCYSNEGKRATSLAFRLLDLGYHYVFALKGGMADF